MNRSIGLRDHFSPVTTGTAGRMIGLNDQNWSQVGSEPARAQGTSAPVTKVTRPTRASTCHVFCRLSIRNA